MKRILQALFLLLVLGFCMLFAWQWMCVSGELWAIEPNTTEVTSSIVWAVTTAGRLLLTIVISAVLILVMLSTFGFLCLEFLYFYKWLKNKQRG